VIRTRKHKDLEERFMTDPRFSIPGKTAQTMKVKMIVSWSKISTDVPAVLLLINRFLVLLLIGSLALFVFHVSMAAVQPPRATVHHGWILCQGEDDRFLVQEPSVHHGLTVRAL